MFILCGCAEPVFNAGGVYYKANIYLCSSFFLDKVTRLNGTMTMIKPRNSALKRVLREDLKDVNDAACLILNSAP